MVFGIITLLVTILSFMGGYVELKRKNFFGVGFATVSVLVFGWFSIRTLVAFILYGGGGSIG